ncbi:MAG: hypothetical protein QME41_00830 [Actinomycetota bacterium]|nr:hypothetical protein [Actinomycetota bacterium]
MDQFIKNREKLIDDWEVAVSHIKDEFGIEKAIGYFVGEKFYNLIEEVKRLQRDNENDPEIINGLERLLFRCSQGIMLTFTEHELNNYFRSNPRFGALGHVLTEDGHRLFVEQEVVGHSIDNEIEDALIMGEMKKYLKVHP